MDLNVEIERLRSEMVSMSHQLDLKDDRIRNMERRIDSNPGHVTAVVEDELHHLRHEGQALKQENNLLREKVSDLSSELDMRSRQV